MLPGTGTPRWSLMVGSPHYTYGQARLVGAGVRPPAALPERCKEQRCDIVAPAQPCS